MYERPPLAAAPRNPPVGIILAVVVLAGGWILCPAALEAQAPFQLAVSPSPLVLEAGGPPGTLTATLTPNADFRRTVVMTLTGLPAGITTSGSRTVDNPYPPQPFTVEAGSGVATGSYTGFLQVTHPEGVVNHPVVVVVQAPPAPPPPPPEIVSITPPTVVAGSRRSFLRLLGQNLRPGATPEPTRAGLEIVGFRLLSETAMEVEVAVRNDAPPGAYGLRVRNADGTTSRVQAISVLGAGSVAGRLAVTGVQLLLPRPGQLVAEGEHLRPRAMVATSGTGTITGFWRVDGVPFDRFATVVTGGQPVTIEATMPIPTSFTGEHRLEIVFDDPAMHPPVSLPYVQVPERLDPLRIVAPQEDGILDRETPLVRWTPVPGASGYEIEVRSGGEGPDGEILAIRRVRDPRWLPETALVEELDGSDGTFRVKVKFPAGVDGPATPWHPLRFGAVAPPGSGSASTAVPAETGGPRGPPEAPRLEAWDDGAPTLTSRRTVRGRPGQVLPEDPSTVDLTVGASGSAHSSGIPGASGAGRLLLSSRTDVRNGDMGFQLTGDFTMNHDLGDPWDSRGESQSWVARLERTGGEIRPGLQVGFAPPGLLDGSEFLTVISNGGGVEGTVETPVGRVSAYRSARLGATVDPLQPRPTVEAGSWESATPDGRFLARASALRVETEPVEGFGGGGGGEGRGYGFLGMAELDPRFQLSGEVATTRFEPHPTSLAEERDGTALRMAVRGHAGTTSYTASVSRADEGFTNPANPGFTPAGQGGRTRAELSLSRTLFDRVAASATGQHLRMTPAGIEDAPTATENGVMLNVSLPAAPWLFLNLAGNASEHRGEAVEALALPASNRSQRGGTVSATQTVGMLSLTQSVGRQVLSDADQPWADQEVTNLQFGAFGRVHELVELSATLAGSLVEGAPEVGETRSVMVSVQPSVRVGASGFRVAPRVAWSRVESDLFDTDARSLQLHGAVRWDAPWEAIRVDLELAGDMARQWDEGDAERPDFDRALRFTVGLTWNGRRTW